MPYTKVENGYCEQDMPLSSQEYVKMLCCSQCFSLNEMLLLIYCTWSTNVQMNMLAR